MPYVTKLNVKRYSCVTEGITTDEVIITDERIAHIEEHHPGDYERIRPFLSEAIGDPDFILGEKSPNTGLVLKYIETEDIRLQVILRLHIATDDPDYKNSIISAWIIGKSRWQQYLDNKIILYKKA